MEEGKGGGGAKQITEVINYVEPFVIQTPPTISSVLEAERYYFLN